MIKKFIVLSLLLSGAGCSHTPNYVRRGLASEAGEKKVYTTADYSKESIAYQEVIGTLQTPILDKYFEKYNMWGDNNALTPKIQVQLLKDVRVKPLQIFRELRAKKPVLDLTKLKMYVVSRDSEVRQILHMPDTFTVRDYRDRMQPGVGDYMLNRDVSWENPPMDDYYNVKEKKWMRQLLSHDDFPKIRKIVRESMEAAIKNRTSSDGTLEVVSQVARVVPIEMVQNYIGFKAPMGKMQKWSFDTQDSFFHNVAYLRSWRGKVAKFTPRRGIQIESERVHKNGIIAAKEMHEYLKDYIANNRDSIMKEDTILSRMLKLDSIDVSGAVNGETERDRVRTSIIGGLVGAVETSDAAIVQSLNQLLRRPEILKKAIAAAKKIDDDDSIHDSEFAGYVWEALRFHPINPYVVRYIEKDTVIGGVTLKKGHRVLVATHSAMHDPRAVENPDTFNFDRPYDDREMNLGYSLHRCLGDYIAEVMIPEILRQLVLLPDLKRVESDIPTVADGYKIPENQGIDFGRRGSFPESFKVQYSIN